MHSVQQRLHWLLTFFLIVSFAPSCAVVDRVQELRQERQVPKEMVTLWEVYQTVRADYAGKEPLDQRRMAEGAVQGMLKTLGEEDTSYLADGAYDLNAPDLGGVWQAWRIIAAHARETGDKVTQEELREGAIRGMLLGLGNPYTAYLNAGRYTLEEQNLHSNFEGIGAWVDLKEGQLTIVGLIPNTPAEGVGMQEGDVVLESDGTPLTGLTVTEAVLMIRGPRGTPVTLLVQRPGEPEPRTFIVVRDVVEQPSAVWEGLTQEIAILQITEFLDQTDERVMEALEEIRAKGYKGLVLDLRGNPGGLLTSTVNVASQFLKDGLVLYHVDARGKRKDFPVQSGGVALDMPLVVLTNGASASGSEVLVGALQDHYRATIVGTRTFGKGSVNELRKLADGSGLYITAALWHTPKGRLIEGEGLEPDVEVLNERVIVQSRGELLVQIIDRQLETAVSMLEAELASRALPAAG
ncbi:MAG: S41 family peptidase [Chloroflexi bacterium]|nr:S41 family peptidase [Chloroflexota bacterium]